MKNVLIVIGDAAETLDTLYPYYRIQEAGMNPVVIAPEKRKYQMVMHEVKPGWTITKEWEGYTLDAELAFSEVDETQSSAAAGLRNTSAMTKTWFASRSTSSRTTCRLPPSATESKSPLMPIV